MDNTFYFLKNIILGDESTQHSQRKWDRLSQKNSRYYIYSAEGQEISEQNFRESGQHDFKNLIENDQFLMNLLEPTKTKVAVEIGSGTGRITEFLPNIFEHVYGLDISKEMINQGNERLKSIAGISLKDTDGEHLPLEDSSVDFVFSYIVFQHMPTVDIVKNNFKEIERVLKPGGVAKIQVRGVPTRKRRWYSGVSFSKKKIEEVIGNLSILKSEGSGEKYFWLWLKK